MITARIGTIGTSIATGKISIMYGCLIPLVLLNRTPPRKEPWLEEGRRPGKQYGGHSREANIMKVWCKRTSSRVWLFLTAMAMVKLLEETMVEHLQKEY